MQHPLKRAILVDVIPPERNRNEAMTELTELVHLVETYGGMVILKIIQKRGRPSAKTYVGEGKAAEIAQMVKDLRADAVVINGFLKANQSNHLINIIPCEVLDRFEMILKIFQRHARTPEAKLQLQIAEHKYEFPKLFGRGAFLSQQAAGMGISTGGAGGGRRAARGPGEKILEVKRRHLRQQIGALEEKLLQFRRVRELQRQRRKRQNFFTAALVGYTNSGKSSLMRLLTKKEHIIVENKLFSTLDTRLGELKMESWGFRNTSSGLVPARRSAALRHAGAGPERVLLADTIGFIQNLPPLLFSSFLATLGEVEEADILLHVVDASDPKVFEKINVVSDILGQMRCDTKPIIYVFNKIDLLKHGDLEILKKTFSEYAPVFVSAVTGENSRMLLNEIERRMGASFLLV